MHGHDLSAYPCHRHNKEGQGDGDGKEADHLLSHIQHIYPAIRPCIHFGSPGCNLLCLLL
jgi:hypothetical protein